MARREELTDQQWSLIEALFDKPPSVPARTSLRNFAEELRTRGELDLSECFIDGTFI